MRRLARVVVAATLVGAGLVLGSGVAAHACSCMEQSLRARVHGADAVFVGTVGGLVEDLNHTNHVEVSTVYQGTVPSDVTVNTGTEDGPGAISSCDYSLVPGEDLVFFAHGSGNVYSAPLCSFPSPPADRLMERVQALTGAEPTTPRATDPADDAAADGTTSPPADEVAGQARTDEVAGHEQPADSGSSSLAIGLLLGLGLLAAGAVAVLAARRRL